MLDPKSLRDNLKTTATLLLKRGFHLDTNKLSALEAARKEIQSKTELLQARRNTLAKTIGTAKSKKEDTTALLEEASHVNDELITNETLLTSIKMQLKDYVLSIPNLLDASVPDGTTETENVLVRTVGAKPTWNFTPKDHVDLMVEKGWADFEAAVMLSRARFSVLYGACARLQRALAQFMLDLHTQEHKYKEVYVPYLVNADSLYGTGQLPKFAEEQLCVSSLNPELYLIPTAEVPVTNLAREKILSSNELPQKYVAHTPCFRSEAGSYGKDTKGLIRQHQFEKVELVQLVKPENGLSAHEALTQDAEIILQKLGLPYRVMLLCAGDTGFASAKTYDLEVWLPGQNAYREISSCSYFSDFQARRLQARYRHPDTGKPELLHTLNGSGLAVGRTLVAILENFQDEQGRVHIPEVLWPYMGGLRILGE